MTELAKHEQPVMPVDPMVSMIERVALDPDSNLEKLERMLAMKKEHDAQNAEKAFNSSWARAAAELPEIPLNGCNTHTKQRYALLRDIMKYTRPTLSKYGLALSFGTETSGQDIIVTAFLSHEGGHTRTNSIQLPRDTGTGRNAVQTIGSSQTYGERYTAQAILGLSLGEDTDDDGNGAGATNAVSPEQFVKLRDLIEESGADEKKFLLAYRADSLEQFPSAKFDAACAQLRRKMEAK